MSIYSCTECGKSPLDCVCNSAVKELPVSTGGKTDFYDIEDCTDVDDLAEHWDFRGDEFNCLKALVGIAKGARHSGTSPLRDARKLVHYSERILRRLTQKDLK